MRRSFIVGLLVLAGLFAFWGLLQSPVSVISVFTHPFTSLWGTHKQLDLELVEISEHIEPASRRLLKPFGEVRLIRTLATKMPMPEQSGDASSSAPSSDTSSR
jgi:hypothetical protein